MDVNLAENIVATKLSRTAVSLGKNASRMNYAVTAMDRYGQESYPVQLLVNAGPKYSAPEIAITDGRAVRVPQSSVIDADFIIIETLSGKSVATRRYAPTISVNGIPDGVYQLRTLGRKGRNHRIGFFSIKRKR